MAAVKQEIRTYAPGPGRVLRDTGIVAKNLKRYGIFFCKYFNFRSLIRMHNFVATGFDVSTKE